MKVLIINGPNINMLGIREPETYGHDTYETLCALVDTTAQSLGVEAECMQSNHEGDLVDAIQGAYKTYDGIVINPAAYTHTSIAILDALKAVNIPFVEVHISDVESREAFRQISYIREQAICTISGKGIQGYADALRILQNTLAQSGQ